MTEESTKTGLRLQGNLPVLILVCACAGLLTGLSAPGNGLWVIAWIGIAPLFVIVFAAPRWWQAALEGLAFGFCYNLVAMRWYLGLAPLDWLGFPGWQGIALATGALCFTSLLQALVFGLLCTIYRLLPFNTQLLPGFDGKRLTLPALYTVPLLWVLLLNKLGNIHDYLGVPWSMIEYSQYLITPVIQIADVIGGIGIGFVIVLANVAIAIAVCHFTDLSDHHPLEPIGQFDVFRNGWAALSLIGLVLAYGFIRLGEPISTAQTSASVVQHNVNIDMQKGEHRWSLSEVLDLQLDMAKGSPPGLTVLSESAIPTELRDQVVVQEILAGVARKAHDDMLMGAIDADREGHLYNAAFAVSAAGKFAEETYHKRYLVPFGEYNPLPNMPEWLRRWTNTPAGSGYTAGREPVVFKLGYGRVSPLICFEVIAPELAAASVRGGGELLVNISDLAWFHQSIIGSQMIACGVFRAVENRRYLIFAANTGPSAIINSRGQITCETGQNSKTVLTGHVRFGSQLTPFTRWFVY